MFMNSLTEDDTMKKKLLCCLLAAVLGVCVFVHRRVILALIRGTEIPQAPSWHCWCGKRA